MDRVSWDNAFASVIADLAQQNTVLPKENWMLTSVKDKVASHRLNDAILEWCEANNIKIVIGTVGIHGHDLPTMVFETFADLFLFKLEFEGRDLPEM